MAGFNPALMLYTSERPDLTTPPAGALGPLNFDAEDPRGEPEYLMGGSLGSFGPGSPTPSPDVTYPIPASPFDEYRPWYVDTNDPRGQPEVVGDLHPGENVRSGPIREGLADYRPWLVDSSDPRGHVEVVGQMGPGSGTPYPDVNYPRTYDDLRPWNVYTGPYDPRGHPEQVGILRSLGRLLGLGQMGPGSDYPAGRRDFINTHDDLHTWDVSAGEYDPRGSPEHVGSMLGLGQSEAPERLPTGPVAPPLYTGPLEWHQDATTGGTIAEDGIVPSEIQPASPGAMGAGLGLFRVGSRAPKARGPGRLGQWWNPLSWIELGFSTIQAVDTTVADTITAIVDLHTDFNKFWADFQLAWQNVYSFLGTAGSFIETSAYDIASIAENMQNMITTLENTVVAEVQLISAQTEALISGFENVGAQFQSLMEQAEANLSEIQTSMAAVVTEIQALRSDFDNYASLVESVAENINSEIGPLPDVTLSPFTPPSLTIPGLTGASLGQIQVPSDIIVIPTFTAETNGLNVTFKDTTQAYSLGTDTVQVIIVYYDFGDGTPPYAQLQSAGGGGTGSAPGGTVTHSYTSSGQYTVTQYVAFGWNSGAGSDTYSAVLPVFVTNLFSTEPPTQMMQDAKTRLNWALDWTWPQIPLTGAVGSAAKSLGIVYGAYFYTDAEWLAATATDQTNLPPGATWISGSMNWGDGTSSAISHNGSATHTYGGGGTYTLTENVNYKTSNGATGSYSHQESLTVYAKTGTIFDTDFGVTVNGAEVTVADTTVWVQGAQLQTCNFNWGDGTTSTIAPGTSTTHTYTSSGTYQITESVTATDGTTSSQTPDGTYSQTVNVQAGGTQVNAGFSYTTQGLSVTVTDTSTVQNGTLSYIVFNWGDGSSPSQVAPGGSATHSYPFASGYNISEQANASNGAADTISQSVTVSQTGTGGSVPPPPQGLYNPTGDTPYPINPAILVPAPVDPTNRVGTQVQRAANLTVAQGGVAESNMPTYQIGPTPYTLSNFASIAKALRLMAQGGVVLTRIENLLATASSVSITTLPQLLNEQQKTNALLATLSSDISQLRQSLASSLPGATSGLGAWGAARRTLGEALYVIQAARTPHVRR